MGYPLGNVERDTILTNNSRSPARMLVNLMGSIPSELSSWFDAKRIRAVDWGVVTTIRCQR